MSKFKQGDKAKVVNMPEGKKHRVGEIVTVGAMGGFDLDPRNVCVLFKDKTMVTLRDHQLEKVSNWSRQGDTASA